jgi:hypothetical protein
MLHPRLAALANLGRRELTGGHEATYERLSRVTVELGPERFEANARVVAKETNAAAYTICGVADAGIQEVRAKELTEIPVVVLERAR